MDSVTMGICSMIVSVEFIMGNLGNGFIILVNCMDLVRRTKISPSDYMLTALAISRIGLLWLLFTKWYKKEFNPFVITSVIMIRITSGIWIVTCHFNLWLATCLSIFYCLKIANFSNSVFLYFKRRVKKVVSVTLLVSLVLLFLHLFQSNTHSDAWIDKCKRNMSSNHSLHDFSDFAKLRLFGSTMFTLIPFAVSLTSFLLLIFSLGKHLKRRQHSARGSRDASTTAHIKALWSMVAFFLLYTFFSLSLYVQLWKSEFQNILLSWFCQIAETAFPSVHSFVLILGNSKLKQTSLSLLRGLKCRPKNVDLSGS